MIAHWAYCYPDGVVHSYTSQQAEVGPAPMADLLLVQLGAPYPGGPGKKVDIFSGAIVSYQPPSPGDSAAQTWAWDEAATDWVASPTLLKRKSDAWSSIKVERTSRLAGTFTHAGNTYDIDPTNLSGASIDAREALIAGEAWSQMWVLADNTVVTLTAAEMIVVGRACKTVVSNLWATSQYLRGLVDAATTIAAVEAITWP